MVLMLRRLYGVRGRVVKVLDPKFEGYGDRFPARSADHA